MSEEGISQIAAIAAMLDDRLDFTEEQKRFIKAVIEKARKLDLECITTRTGERDAYKLRCEELQSRAAHEDYSLR